MQFYQILRNLCEKIGKTPSAVAKELNINTGGVTYWKNGHTPTMKTLEKLSEYFNVSTDYLLGKENTLSDDEKIYLELLHKVPKEKREQFIENIKQQIDLFYK